MGLVVKDSVRSYDFRPIIDRWMVGITMIKTLSIGAGGGSIASLNDCCKIACRWGRSSAGSMPGPACFNLGGTEPTVTDADVVLGYINPDYYSAGSADLNKETGRRRRSETRWRSRWECQRGRGARRLIRKIVNGNMSSAIMKEVHLRGYSPEEFILFVGGGAGATHAEGFKVGYSQGGDLSVLAGVLRIWLVDDGHHARLRGVEKITLMEPRRPEARRRITRHTTERWRRLIEQAHKDLSADGMDPKTAAYLLELDMLYGGQFHVKRALSPRLSL